MNDDYDEYDDYAPEEPVATGTVRTELRGDIQAAHRLIRTGRRMLGQLRSIHGVNQRINDGEAGGFYTQRRQLDDGSLLEVITNDGQDTLRITCPTRPGAASLQAVGVESRTSTTSTPSAYEHSEVPELPLEEEGQPKPKKEEEEEEANPRTDYDPYLWVGVRFVSGNEEELYQLHACIWEPPHEEGDEPVILSNRNELHDSAAGEDVYPLQRWSQFTEADTAAHRVAYTDDKLYMLLKENGYPMTVPDAGQDDTDEFKVVFISDPDNDMALMTPSGPMIGTTTGGTFYVKVMVVGPDCGPNRIGNVEVEVRVITGKGEYRTDNQHRFTITSFTSYKMGILPKGWFEPHEPFDPSDCDDCETPVPDYGPNPHGPHWWQGAATIELAPSQVMVRPNEVQTSTTEFADELTLPPTGFAPGGWFSNADLCPRCEYVFTQYFTLGGDDSVGWTFPPANCEDELIVFQWSKVIYTWLTDAVLDSMPSLRELHPTSYTVTGVISGRSYSILCWYGPDPPPAPPVYSVSEVTMTWAVLTGEEIMGICFHEPTEFATAFIAMSGEQQLRTAEDILGACRPDDTPMAYFKGVEIDNGDEVTQYPAQLISRAQFLAETKNFTEMGKQECRRVGSDED